jgi:hypothetical protein
MVKKTEAALPNPAKFVDMLIGKGSNYTFSTALADLIDNSIEFGATDIAIEIDFSQKIVTLLDNGQGMDRSTLTEAMKFAAETRDYSARDLGKFGTGMKAASLSQADKMTVATKRKGSEDLNIRCLDRQHIRETNDWNQLSLILEPEDLPESVQLFFANNHGTAVVWERLTSIDSSRGVGRALADDELLKAIKSAELHLAMVFHRFLSGEAKARSQVSITINGREIEPYDPFARAEKTWIEEPVEIKVNQFPLRIQGFVLPPEKEWSSAQAHKEHGRPKGWNDSQGFYLYRNDRLIQWGTWLRTRKSEPHMSLARIAVDFESQLDEVLSVTVDKSKVTLPEIVKERLDPSVLKIVKRAKDRYRSKNAGLTTTVLPGRKDQKPTALQRKLTAAALAELMERVAARHSLSDSLGQIKNLVKEEYPSEAKELGW